MRAVRSLIWRLGNLVRPSRTEREMGDELTFHIQSRAEDLVRKGLSSSDADRQARLDFGGIERYKEQCRDTRSVPGVRECPPRSDLRLAKSAPQSGSRPRGHALAWTRDRRQYDAPCERCQRFSCGFPP